MKKLFFFLVILFGCETKNDSLPNVILVLVDDLGYNDVGFNGSNDIRTPNIDMLSHNGVTFTNGYALTQIVHQVEQELLQAGTKTNLVTD